MTIDDLFEKISALKVAVVGDVMLDTYWWGKVDRISPEAPVPIVSVDKKEYRIGGAGNVALNTVSLGAATTIFSVVGQDGDGKVLLELLQEHNVDTKYITRSNARITTNKTRVIARNQQMLRLDAEQTGDIDRETEDILLREFTAYVSHYKPNVLIFEDYNKGVLTARVIREMISTCKSAGIVTAVDPKRKHFLNYIGVDLFKPNMKEVQEALNLLPDETNANTLDDIHGQLKKHLSHTTSFITLSEKGVYFNKSKKGKIVPSHLRNIADVSGAGDTVIAVAALVIAASNDVELAAEVANIAGGLVCEEVGTVAIDRQRLLEECEILLQHKQFIK